MIGEMPSWVIKVNNIVESDLTSEKSIQEIHEAIKENIDKKEQVINKNQEDAAEEQENVKAEMEKEEAVSPEDKEKLEENNSMIELEDSDDDNSQKKSDKSESELDKSSTDLDGTVTTDLDGTVTPKKNTSGLERGSSRKKLSATQQKARDEREKKRLEAKELQEKIKQERKEQKIKERQEKEEQKKKDKLEKEEQKRKEKEEKDEQKRKEKEEKEEQKRKEKEEKDEQKRKEKEEKEEQKRKEKEEKEMKKQQELSKDKKKLEKESQAFVNFFVTKKSSVVPDTKKEETEDKKSSFMPFAVKADMRLAPLTRYRLSSERKDELTNKIESQKDTILYFDEIKSKSLGKTTKTWPVEDEDIVIVNGEDIGECLEEQAKANKMRAKLLKFHENRRPAYWGTWRKKSKYIHPRKPFELDKDFFDYEVDSDDDWEEEEPGESLHGSDDEEKENESDDYEVDNDFFVPHGYLSDEEIENEENVNMTPETQKEKLKLLQMEFEQEMKSKTEKIKPRLIGCIWESKLKPKIQDAINTFLAERMMIVTGPIIIQKKEVKSVTKTPTARKLLSKELIPEFLKMIHGSKNKKTFLVNEFIHYLSKKNTDIPLPSKLGLCTQLKELAQWKKCPDEGPMFNKHCWYVDENTRKEFNVDLNLLNKWPNTNKSVAKKKLNL